MTNLKNSSISFALEQNRKNFYARKEAQGKAQKAKEEEIAKKMEEDIVAETKVEAKKEVIISKEKKGEVEMKNSTKEKKENLSNKKGGRRIFVRSNIAENIKKSNSRISIYEADKMNCLCRINKGVVEFETKNNYFRMIPVNNSRYEAQDGIFIMLDPNRRKIEGESQEYVLDGYFPANMIEQLIQEKYQIKSRIIENLVERFEICQKGGRPEIIALQYTKENSDTVTVQAVKKEDNIEVEILYSNKFRHYRRSSVSVKLVDTVKGFVAQGDWPALNWFLNQEVVEISEGTPVPEDIQELVKGSIFIARESSEKKDLKNSLDAGEKFITIAERVLNKKYKKGKTYSFELVLTKEEIKAARQRLNLATV